jgi:hypothetical protein
MSALGQKRTLCAATADALFDRLIGAGEQGLGHRQAQRAFAVFRFIASSYLLGACTGRSPGFPPRNIPQAACSGRRRMSAFPKADIGPHRVVSNFTALALQPHGGHLT